jgi:hypothetical protein
MTRFAVAVPLFVLSLFLSSTSPAQVPDTGAPFFGATRSDADPLSFINLANLNIHTTIAVYSKNGIIPFSAAFVRDNTTYRVFSPAPGASEWLLSIGYALDIALQATSSGIVTSGSYQGGSCPDGSGTTAYGNWYYADPSQTVHSGGGSSYYYLNAPGWFDPKGCLAPTHGTVTTQDGYILNINYGTYIFTATSLTEEYLSET